MILGSLSLKKGRNKRNPRKFEKELNWLDDVISIGILLLFLVEKKKIQILH
jgi:hypothetical protein